MATYAVGDLQGCLEPLQCLLNQVKFNPEEDTLWLTGDLINRGPASLETLRFVYQMRDSVVCVLGNHDLHLLAAARGHRAPSRSDTLDAIIAADDRVELLQWLHQQPLLHHDAELGYTMTHAGIPPQWTLDQAQSLAREVEQTLRSDHLDGFLSNMYGNKPASWDDSLSGFERLRVITNYFTRMRFCTAKGKLEFKSKGDINDAPEGFKPWFAHKMRVTAEHRLIFGHWASLQGECAVQNVFALDGGCVWGGEMIMMRLDDQQRFHCECNR